jgi:hypothetical protein
VFQESVQHRLLNESSYCPGKIHGGQSEFCLKHKGVVPRLEQVLEQVLEVSKGGDTRHKTFTFSPAKNHPKDKNGWCPVM